MGKQRGRVARLLRGITAGTIIASASWAAADELELRNGGRLSGIVVERTASSVTLETAPGLITLPLSRVARINDSRSALDTWYVRSWQLSATDVAGWTTLARWAAEHDLLTPARTAWERVLALDPGHPEANIALGNVQVDGRWMSREEGYRAQGLVPFEGRWVPRAEAEAALREQAAAEAAARERKEADKRAREEAEEQAKAAARQVAGTGNWDSSGTNSDDGGGSCCDTPPAPQAQGDSSPAGASDSSGSSIGAGADSSPGAGSDGTSSIGPT